MSRVARSQFRLARRSGIVLTWLAWITFLVSFFLPTALQIGSMLGSPLARQSGWQTLVDTYALSLDAAGDNPLALLCLLSPLVNLPMLIAPVTNLTLKHYAGLTGALLFFGGIAAIWVCTQVYEGLAIGFYFWIGSILAMALASFLISGSWIMEDNEEHERLLADLKASASRTGP
jgi:hypothetical protein